MGIGIGIGSSGANESEAWKLPVHLATTAALPACARVGNVLTAAANGPLGNLDGIATVVGRDYLVKDEGGAPMHINDGAWHFIQEGVAGPGGRPWIMERSVGWDTTDKLPDGSMVVVQEGATLAGHCFELVTDNPVINVSALEFRDQGTLLALVTIGASGTVNAFGATIDCKFCSDGITPGGVWQTHLNWRGASIGTGDLRFDTQGSIHGEEIGAAANTVLWSWDGTHNTLGADTLCRITELRSLTETSLYQGGTKLLELSGKKLTTPASITLSPLGGGADDVPQILAALLTGKYVYLGPGAWRFDTQLTIPNIPGQLVFQPGATWTSSLPGVALHANIPIQLVAVEAGAGHTTLHGVNTVGTKLLKVHADVPDGSLIRPRSLVAGVYKRQVYTVISCVPNGAEFDITTDRPVRFQWADNDEVKVLISHPHDFHIYFNGALGTGTGYRAINFVDAHNCSLHNANINCAGFVGMAWSFDEGCYECHTFDCHTDGAGGGPLAAACTCETGEQCSHERIDIGNVPNVGLTCNDSIGCWFTGKIHSCGATGAVFGGSDVALGSQDCAAELDVTKCTQHGIMVTQGSQRTLLRRCLSRFNTLDGSLVDAAAVDTKYRDCILSDNANSGLEIAGASTGTLLDGVVAERNAFRAITPGTCEFQAKNFIARDNVQGAFLISGGGSFVKVDGFTFRRTGGAASNMAQHNGTGVLELLNGTMVVPGGDTCVYNSATGTIIRQNVQCSGGAGSIGYFSQTASKLYDRNDVDDTGCAVHMRLWAATPLIWRDGPPETVALAGGGTVAQLNWGTVTCNGTTEVDTPNLWIAGATDTKKIVWGLGTIDAAHAPQLQPYEDKARAAGHFYTKVQTALDVTVWTYRLVE